MSFPMPGAMNPDDIRYMHCDAVIQGKDRNRIKYLDLEGRWVLSGRSIPYISSVFNHIENLNYARGPLFDITEPALNAIGMVGWTAEKKPEETKKKPFVLERPRVEVQEEAPPSPREVLPHRTAGYGPEHHVKRKISLPSRDRSRSPSVSPSRGESPMPAYDKYATKYKRKDSGSDADDEFDLPLPPPAFDDLPLPPPPTVEELQFWKPIAKTKKSEETKKPDFEKLVAELNRFNRKMLRSIEAKPTEKPKSEELSPRERLNKELLSFNHSKLRHVKTREKKLPNIILSGVKTRQKPTEEFELRFARPKDSKGCQTDLLNELKTVLAAKKPLNLNISPNSSRKSSGSKNDSGFASPVTPVTPISATETEISSPEFLDKNKWKLVEEKVCKIRVVETEYF